MNLYDTIDIYCERTDIGVLQEPMNVITNIAFIVAAAYLYLVYQERHHRDRQARNLIALVAIIGVGSGLFHTFANVLTMFMDVIPIAIFVFYYLWVALRRFLHWDTSKIMLALLAFAGVVAMIRYIPSAYSLNGSIAYLPCLAAIVFIGLRLKAIHHEAAETFFIASTWFAVSLFFRIIDMATCGITGMGTHFLWHVCNSVVLLILTKIVIEHPPLTLKNN